MINRLKSLGLKVTSPGYRVKLVPDEDDLMVPRVWQGVCKRNEIVGKGVLNVTNYF